MKLPIISLVFIIIPLQISGQGITKHGRSAAEAPDFVNRNGKLINMPSLNRYGQELFKVTVTTFPVTSVTSNSAESGGRIENPDNIEIIACGVCWSTSPGPDISDYKTSENTDVTEFTSHLTRLIPSTTYYLRAYVTTIAGTAYGEEISFRTLPRTDPSECLIAWYPFNGNADEATGFGIDGIVNGAVLSEDRFGNTESAYYFNGIDNSITIPGYLPVTNTFTLSFWAYNEKVKGSANIITDGSRNIGGMDFLLNFRGNEIGIRADKGSLLNYEYSSPAELRNLNLLNRWVHVAWVMDEGKSSIFLDGAKIADIAVTGSNVGYHDDHITIGARHVWTAMDNFFQGRLDEFRIYSCNLQPDEIYSIYTAEGPMLPYVTTVFISDTTSSSITVESNIISDGGAAITERGVCWSISPDPTVIDNKTSDGSGIGIFTSRISGLRPETTYYIRPYAISSAGISYGKEISFRTLPRTDPSECLIAWYPFNGNADEATGMGTDGVVNGAALTEDRFGNAESAYYFNGIDNSMTIPGHLPVTNTFTLSFWAYNEKVNGSANIITDGSINIGSMDFLLNFRGNEIGIRADKGALLNYEYSSPTELRNLNLLNRWVHVAWVMDEGKSSIFLDGLKIADIAVTGSNEGYHDDHITIGARHVWTAMDNFFQGRLDEFRIYSCNLQPDEIYSIYTAEGPMLPYVTTVFISDTTSSSITVESNIISDGGTEVTERGVVWSTSLNPTIHDNKTSDGSGKGSFTSHITGLLPGTTYYLKSYAINNAGTFYGNEWSFRTHDTLSNCGTVTDIDGNIYNTVTIGNQCWMKENLKTTRYSDGTPISLVDEQNIWSKLSISDKAYCWYNNDINNKNPYGALYTWAAAMNGADSSTSIPSGIQGVCPTGWHLPSWSEWGILIQYLDPQIVDPLYLRGSSIAGGKMKESGFTYWDYPNTGATNESGFSGLPGGGRSEDGEFLFLGNSSYWWSTSQFGSGNYTRVQNLNYNNSSNQMTSTPWKSGISVRCIKNVDQLIQLPVITTTQISHISDTSATSGGKIINNGGDEIIARGICWSLSTNPTTTNNKTNSGTGTGLFIDHIGPLTPGTTYYVRAYATNSAGTAYGNEEVFVTCDYIPPVAFNSNLAYGVITDIEGNFYKTIKIGNQEWMAENLRTTKYNNGESIPVITDNDTWQSLSEGALCWLNDNICYKNTYGGIYNWYAANNNLCPVGWHLPTNEEWSVMNRALGGNEIAGGKLKEQGFSHWSEPNTGATNESGFSALPTGGFRNGALFVTGEFASFWTSTEYPDNQAFYRSLQHQYSIEGYSWGYKSNGANVRCLKGPAPPKPSVTTLWARNIMSDKAEIVSVISSVLPVNSRGVCWNTSPAPEVLDNKTTNDGGTGSFTSLLTGLESNTTYYVRAYSINDDGITYGNEITFSTVEDLPIGGLAAYWPFNGNANDESGNNNNGTVYGATLVADRFGNPEKAYYFNGISNKIYIGNSLIVQGHITVACWIKSTDIGNQIISSGSRNSYRIGKTKDGVDAAVYLTDSSDGYGLDVHAVTDCSDWTHVAIVYNGVSLDLYVNGQLMDSAYGPGNVFCNQPVYLNFGTYQWLSTYYGFYQGYLDDVYMFNRALSNSEIEALYHEGGW